LTSNTSECDYLWLWQRLLAIAIVTMWLQLLVSETTCNCHNLGPWSFPNITTYGTASTEACEYMRLRLFVIATTYDYNYGYLRLQMQLNQYCRYLRLEVRQLRTTNATTRDCNCYCLWLCLQKLVLLRRLWLWILLQHLQLQVNLLN